MPQQQDPFSQRNVSPEGPILSSLIGVDPAFAQNLFTGTPKSLLPFTQPTQGTGANVPLPQGSGISGLLNNPFGLALPQGKIGSVGIFGGPRDLQKSLAVNSMGTNLINQQFQQPMLPQGTMGAISGYAQNNPYLQSMTQAYLPQLQSQGFQQQQAYQGQLRDMMNQSYLQSGELYGGQLGAVAAAKATNKAKIAQKKALLSGIIGGAVGGLTGNQFGEGDTTKGLVGAIG